MPNFKVIPIPAEVANSIRTRLIDEEGHQLSISLAGESDYGPCRSCLKQFNPGDRRILFSYRPNPVDHPYNEAGPVFIHFEDCPSYADYSAFPPEVENGRIKFPLVFRAYDNDGRITGAHAHDGGSAGTALRTLFENDQVAFVHVRNALAGCFVTHLDRVSD
jgi:hypothetical protein